jgi:hypothetical protein
MNGPDDKVFPKIYLEPLGMMAKAFPPDPSREDAPC